MAGVPVKLRVALTVALLMSVGFFALVSVGSHVASAASPAPYVTVTLTNSQTTPTPKNFQQLIKVDWSTYSSELNANVSNVRFYNSTTFSSSTELTGWIETNNTTAATSSNVWVNLSGTIVPASGSVNIYMAFLSTTSSWSSHWGLAPQLDKTYGKHDNGAKVFEFYDNFAGTALKSGWTNMGNALTPTVNNGVTLASSGTPNDQGYYYSGYTMTTGSVLESYMSDTGAGTTRGSEIGIGTSIFGGTGTRVESFEVTPAGTTWYLEGYVTADVSTPAYASGTKIILSGAYLSGGATEYQNYVSVLSGSATATTSDAYPNFGVYQDTIFLQWMRVRAYPPDGVMPAASFGSLTITGYQISFQQTSLPSGAEWGIRLNNTTTAIWLNSTAKYDNITGLFAGSYTFRVINATGYASNPYTGLLTIVSTNLTQSIVFTGYAATFTESGLPAGLEWFINLSNQPGLSESSTGQHLSATGSSAETTLPNATYTFTWQDKKNAEYHGGSSSFTVNGAAISEAAPFAPVLYYINFTAKGKPPGVTWDVNLSNATKFAIGQGIQFTQNKNISFSVTNGTYYYNASADNSTTHMPLGWWRLTNAAGTILLHNISTFKGVELVVSGASVRYNNITFTRAYNVTFEEVGIGNTFTWTDSLYNPITASSQSRTLTVANSETEIRYTSTEGNWTNGTYTISVQTLVSGVTGVRYQNFSSFSSLSVAGSDLVLPVNFITQYFLTTRSVPAAGGYHSPYSEWVNASTDVTLSAQPNSSYEFTGFVGTNASSYTGPGSYSNGQYLTTILMTNPITENMTFGNYLVLTFYMQNLTTGTEWGVELTDAAGLVQWDNGTGNYIVFELEAGTYTYTVTGVTSYPQTNTISVSTSETVLLQYQVSTYQVSFQEAGLPAGQPWTVSVASSQYTFIQSSSTANIYFRLPNGIYSYSAGSVYGYMANNSSGGFSISGAGVMIYVNWTEGNLFILEGIRYFVPIFLNTTNFTIPAGTQIPLSINWTKYQKYEDQNLSNVMILNSTFYPLYSWIENNASSLNTSSTVWTKLQAGITYYSSQVLYLVFMQDQRNNLNKVGYWGEAPQLSPLFGEWNNIRLVMNPGLVYQVYYPANNYQINSSDLLKLQNTNMVKGSSVYSVFNATVNFGFTAASGATDSVYYTIDGGTNPSVTSVVENNVLFTYGLWSALDTFPNPPVGFDTYTAFMIKMFGFAVTNVAATYYTVPDNVMQIWEQGNNTSPWTSMSGMREILNANQQGSATDTFLSAPATVQGAERIALIYAQGSPVGASSPNPGSQGPANMNLWTSSPVSFYSPTPVNRLPTVAFGSPGSSYSSFTEYGLPAGTIWAIGINNEILQSNSNVIYDYLPTGTYFFTVGSLTNDTFLSGIDGSFFPTPGQGFLTVNTFFTSQVILWTHANIKTYDLIPGQASAVFRNSVLNITMPVFVTDVDGLPANTSTIATIWSHLQLRYVSKLQSQDFNVSWSFSNSGLGMFAVFFSLTKAQVSDIKNGTAVVSLVSAFRFGTFTSLATGVAGTSSFNGINISSPTKPPPNILGLGQPPPGANLNSIQGILTYLGYLGQSAVGRSIYFVVILLALLYYVLRINAENVKKTKRKPS